MTDTELNAIAAAATIGLRRIGMAGMFIAHPKRPRGPRVDHDFVLMTHEWKLESLAAEVDEVVCLLTPPALYAIGVWYEDFPQVSDEEVIRLLALARPGREQGAAPPS